MRDETYTGRQVPKDPKKQEIELVNQMSFERQINIFDEDAPLSAVNLMPKHATFMRERILAVPDKYRNATHYELRKEIKPCPTLNQLRINFWTEYDNCIDKTTGSNRKINIANVVAGVCSYSVFREHMRDIKKVAWIVTPVQSYQMGVQDILETCLYKMRSGLEKLEMDSVKDMNTILKIYETFDKRVHGDYTQKVEKTVNYTGANRVSNEEVKSKMVELGIQNNNVVTYEVSNEK